MLKDWHCYLKLNLIQNLIGGLWSAMNSASKYFFLSQESFLDQIDSVCKNCLKSCSMGHWLVNQCNNWYLIQIPCKSIAHLTDPIEEQSASLHSVVYKCSSWHTVISALKQLPSLPTITVYGAQKKPEAGKVAGIKKNRLAQVCRLTRESLK